MTTRRQLAIQAQRTRAGIVAVLQCCTCTFPLEGEFHEEDCRANMILASSARVGGEPIREQGYQHPLVAARCEAELTRAENAWKTGERTVSGKNGHAVVLPATDDDRAPWER